MPSGLLTMWYCIIVRRNHLPRSWVGKDHFSCHSISRILLIPLVGKPVVYPHLAPIMACFQSGATHWRCQVGEERGPRTDVTAMAGEALEGH